MKQPSEQEIDRLQTKARAATTLRAELDSLSRSARRLSRLTIEGRLRSMIDRYDHSTGALNPVRIQQEMATMLSDAVENPPVGFRVAGMVHGPMQQKSLRPTLEDLQAALSRSVDAIKYVRDTAQLGLKEAKEYVDILRGL